MKTAGIIGGIAPESTIQYYRQAVIAYQARTKQRVPFDHHQQHPHDQDARFHWAGKIPGTGRHDAES